VADFHLGFRLDPKTGKPGADRLTIESGDLTTHGVIVGMTGSGKTGLAVVLIEEALLAGVPCLLLDPKGDLGNLALVFPELAPESFRPWVNEAEAQAEGISPDELAKRTATVWREGLEGHGIGRERLQALRDAADVTIYTPGSSAGTPLNVVGSLRAPALSWETEAEAIRDEIEGTVTSLLNLVGIAADPLSSREHVLLSNLIENAWRAGQSLDLGGLIAQVQTPPLRKLGVFELDAFFPPKERTELAFKLNALVASPTFTAWGEGAPLDPQALLFTAEGKPRAAVVYLAHLSDQERMFVVTLVLSKLVTWMRGQPGAPDLRVLAYMDEVFGFVPPTAAPPAKKPILTVFKQGRAFGVGMVLATQNPVDLDYKAMSNAGTWLVGRLQTENDKARVLEGLRSAAGGADVAALDTAIGGLGKRQFLLVSAKSNQPALFGTRWAMSYLRGPLTKDEVARLKQTTAASEALPAPAQATEAPPAPLSPDATPVPPGIAAGVPVFHLDPAAAYAADVGAVPGGTHLRPALAVRCSLRYDDAKAGLDELQEWEAIVPVANGAVDLAGAKEVDYDARDFRPEPPAGAVYALTSAPLGEASFFTKTAKEIERRLVDGRPLEILRNPALKLYSRPGETREQFAARCAEAAQAKADEEVAKIRDRLEARRDRLEDALMTAQRQAAEAAAEVEARQQQQVAAGAGALLGALLGGRSRSKALSQMLGGSGGATGARAQARARAAQAKAQDKAGDLAALEQELAAEIAEISAKWDAKAAEIEAVPIRLESSDVRVTETALVWIPGA
jgi:ElaB/YqjD/DUF883 family membrane-anchored ribosome-binding protein